jgi:predicted DNA-binding mobile mystery protein A
MNQLKNNLRLQRDQLDQKLIPLRSLQLSPPKNGWIHAIRESLGMSASQLAKRLKIPRQNLHRIEQNEVTGHITVATLKKIADQLSCDLQITFIPKTSLQNIIEKRAMEVAQRTLQRTNLHMALEDQKTNENFLKNKIKELADDLIRTSDKRLWEDP